MLLKIGREEQTFQFDPCDFIKLTYLYFDFDFVIIIWFIQFSVKPELT